MAVVYSANARSFPLAKEALAKALKINEEYFGAKWKTEIWWRVFRPEDFNPTFTPETRDYSTDVGPTDTRLLNASAQLIVPADTLIVIYGWVVRPAVDSYFSPQAVIQVRVNGQIKHDALPCLIQQTEDGIWLTTDQMLVLKPNDRVDIFIRDPALGAGETITAMIMPIGTYSEIVSRAANL